ncbi:unnamed protein product [Mycena citricolor]|uniref:Uncharacterized protein n=2 Tax=Mycena citricolor TaxID=2018698 RepID=A0AAD2HDS9_9AGAR|nr:unnamed protein product [Mycena citricolor]
MSLLRNVLKRNQRHADTASSQTDGSEIDKSGAEGEVAGVDVAARDEAETPTFQDASGKAFNPSSSKRSLKSYAASISKLSVGKKSIKSYASTIRSSGGRTIRSLAESMMSFYSLVTMGGTRVPKRRRPDFSTLGVPHWYESDPPSPPLMDGTEESSPIPTYYNRGISGTLHARSAGEKPWLGVVIYSHARPESVMPMYHNAAKVLGEVRLKVARKMKIRSIDVWVIINTDSVLDLFSLPHLAMKATVWNRAMGDPRRLKENAQAVRALMNETGTTTESGFHEWQGKFPKGTFVFPFAFPAFPADFQIKHFDDTKKRNLSRVPLPPSHTITMVTGFSGSIKYTVGVNIDYDKVGEPDEEFDMPMQYLPLSKRVVQEPTPFPYLPTREDWPLRREVIGGWQLTPFGGRGRLGEEMVEMEGILGVQLPAVVTAGDVVQFSLLLWSKNELTLEALGQPGAVEVAFLSSDMFAANVMHPRTSSRKDRYLGRLGYGRVWRTDDGRPDDEGPVPEIKMVQLPDPPAPGSVKHPQLGSHTVKGAQSKRMREVWIADTVNEDEQVASTVQKGSEPGSSLSPDDGNALSEHNVAFLPSGEDAESNVESTAADSEATTTRAPSPTPSTEEIEVDFEEIEEPDHFLRMDGEIKIPACTHPSYRFPNMGREYVVHLIFSHPQYMHISPNATGILAEFPVWYVLDRFHYLPPSATTPRSRQTWEQLNALPRSGAEVPIDNKSFVAPFVEGVVTTEKRPTAKFTRYFAF